MIEVPLSISSILASLPLLLLNNLTSLFGLHELERLLRLYCNSFGGTGVPL